MRAVAVLAVLLLLLSGCSKKLSADEMQERAEDALVALEKDIGPDGRVAGFDMTGSVTIETATAAGTFPVSVQASATVAFGTDADVRIDGRVARVTYQVYCDPDRVVVVTDGFEEYGERDEDLEMRNPAGTCTGRDAEPLLDGLGDLDFADPALLTGHFDPATLTPVGVESTGKRTFDAVYTSRGAAGASEVTVHMDGRDIHSFTIENPESRLTLTPQYGERGAQEAPQAARRYPAMLFGEAQRSTSGYRFTVVHGLGGPLDEHTIQVHDDAVTSCSDAPTPVVSFDLGDGEVQERDGFRLTLQDDGDGRLGEDDWFLLQHPQRGSETFGYEVVVFDDWAGAPATPRCGVPAPGALGGLGVLTLLAFALRRR